MKYSELSGEEKDFLYKVHKLIKTGNSRKKRELEKLFGIPLPSYMQDKVSEDCTKNDD